MQWRAILTAFVVMGSMYAGAFAILMHEAVNKLLSPTSGGMICIGKPVVAYQFFKLLRELHSRVHFRPA